MAAHVDSGSILGLSPVPASTVNAAAARLAGVHEAAFRKQWKEQQALARATKPLRKALLATAAAEAFAPIGDLRDRSPREPGQGAKATRQESLPTSTSLGSVVTVSKPPYPYHGGTTWTTGDYAAGGGGGDPRKGDLWGGASYNDPDKAGAARWTGWVGVPFTPLSNGILNVLAAVDLMCRGWLQDFWLPGATRVWMGVTIIGFRAPGGQLLEEGLAGPPTRYRLPEKAPVSLSLDFLTLADGFICNTQRDVANPGLGLALARNVTTDYRYSVLVTAGAEAIGMGRQGLAFSQAAGDCFSSVTNITLIHS